VSSPRMPSIFAFRESACFFDILVALLLQDVEGTANPSGLALAATQV
jgi:hypothetical protein